VRIRHLIARRGCLAGMLAALGLPWAGLFMRSWTRNAHNELALTHSSLLALLDHPRYADAIGLAYLSTLSAEQRSAEHLIRAIFADAPLTAETPRAWTIVAHLVNERMRLDFSEGTVVTVGGWILSHTEARLYALAALA
jgi:hypothetical protein